MAHQECQSYRSAARAGTSAPAVRTLAVVGPLADECELDWYSGSLIRRSSPREALADRLGAERVVFADGLETVRLRTAAGWVRVPDPAEDEGPAGNRRERIRRERVRQTKPRRGRERRRKARQGRVRPRKARRARDRRRKAGWEKVRRRRVR
ncbi:hypothetical protein JOF35_006232 [Streptomyces demainii]|uniref:Uncharacterized protein n=1 Tax=Streptomyces demainii TaxID=588122 RepID=A0ABT9KZU6_9ACTN|nr:hypothetical protein [Streptomyces demainii]